MSSSPSNQWPLLILPRSFSLFSSSQKSCTQSQGRQQQRRRTRISIGQNAFNSKAGHGTIKLYCTNQLLAVHPSDAKIPPPPGRYCQRRIVLCNGQTPKMSAQRHEMGGEGGTLTGSRKRVLSGLACHPHNT